MKKRERDEIDSPGASASGTASSGPLNRPKAGRKSSHNTGIASSGNSKGFNPADLNNQKAYTSTLETRLNNLEAVLRSIPPGIHNALISNLDGQLAVGSAVGPSTDVTRGMQGIISTAGGDFRQETANPISQNGGKHPTSSRMGMGNDLPNRNGTNSLSNSDHANAVRTGINLANLGIPQSAFGVDLSEDGRTPGYNLATGSGANHLYNNAPSNLLSNRGAGVGGFSVGLEPQRQSISSMPVIFPGNPTSGLDFGGFDINQPTLADFISDQVHGQPSNGLEEVERGMEGLNLSNGYLYVDEIGQTKWQGKVVRSHADLEV
jgi:hypothetical protein